MSGKNFEPLSVDVWLHSRLLKYRFWGDSLKMLTSQNALQAIFSAWLRDQLP